jgi:hypothetical protein
LLEKYPSLTYAQAKEILLQNVKKDTFTTPSANNAYGYGKLNTYQALIYPTVFGCTDTGAYNFNPLANIDDNSCIPKIYGCTDTGAINYNAAANTNDGSCILKVYGCLDSNALNYNPAANMADTCMYAPSYIKAIETNSTVKVFPNPASDNVTFQSNNYNLEKQTIIIQDIIGTIVKTLEIKNNIASWACDEMARGAYMYIVKANDSIIESGKIVLQ